MTQTPTGPVEPQNAQYYEQASSEWESAFIAYRAAQARLAYAGAFLALNAWEEMINPASFARSLSRWLDYVVRIIRSFRARQRRLSQPYYQYGRALELEETFGQPLGGHSPTLQGYRGAFLDQLQDAALLDASTPSDWDVEDDMDEIREELIEVLGGDDEERTQREDNFRSVDLDRAIQRFLDKWEDRGDRQVEVQAIEWPDREADNADQIHRELFREEARRLWQEEEQRSRNEDELDDEDEDDKPDRQSMLDRLNDASRRVGNRMAGKVMSATSHAADQVTNWAMDRDERVYGVARGTGPNPCALCAIAASRGFVYRSVSSAMTTTSAGSGFKRYHENCQCYPIIRWSRNQAEPETTLKWRRIYQAALSDGGNVFNAFRRRVHAETADHVNARRRRYYQQNKHRISAQRKARRRRNQR